MEEVIIFPREQNSPLGQGCQMAYFQTQNPKFGSILEGITMDDVGIFH
jgi:hypothetical protein